MGKNIVSRSTRAYRPGFRSQSLAVSQQVTEAINQTVGCRYFPPGWCYLPSRRASLRRHLMVGTKLYCLVSDAHRVCTICYSQAPTGSRTRDR